MYARMIRIPYRKIIRLVVVLYTVLLTVVLVVWKSTGRYPFEKTEVIITHRHISYIPSEVSRPVVTTALKDWDKAFLNMAEAEGEKGCTLKKTSILMKKRVLLNQDPVCGWIQHVVGDDRGVFWNFGNAMTRLKDVIIDPTHAEGRKGGEEIQEVLNQREEDEYLKLSNGYFKIKCNTGPKSVFSAKDHLNSWSRAVQCSSLEVSAKKQVNGMTLAVMRYEYVNLYHTMTDYYNAFLAMLMFNQSPDNVTILWIDAHPKGSLDSTWDVLFGDTMRAGHLKGPTYFEDMVWSVMGYNSPLSAHSRPYVPYLELFREFFLSRHGIKTTKTLDCNQLNIMFIWRRDYLAHPRNPKGLVKRKIANEDELLAKAKNILPKHNITGVQLDILPMEKQLALVANTDIILGMHGAGLTHTLFLPRHAGLIEFYPIYWTQANRHFRAISGWRGLKYSTWQNHVSENEKVNYATYIPPETMANMLLTVKAAVCKSFS